MNYKTLKLIIYLIIIVEILSSCNQTRFVPEDKYLVDKVTIECDNKQISKSEIENYIKQKPNRKILILFNLKLNLYVYNFAKRGKERKWKNWVATTIGEEPVIYDEFMTQKSVKQIKLYLKNKGYYYTEIHDTLLIKRKKATSKYKIIPNKPLIISELKYKILDTSLNKLIIRDTANCLIKKNIHFDIETLQNERNRITKYVKNLGYYRFTRDFIEYEVDTISNNEKLDLSLIIKHNLLSQKDSINSNHKKYIVRNIYVYPDYKQDSTIKYDSLHFEIVTFWHRKSSLLFKNNALSQKIFIIPNSMYQLDNVEKTYQQLSSLGLYKSITISFEELKKDSINCGLIDCFIRLIPNTLQSYQFEVEGTNSGGNIGVAGSYTYQHKNIFHGFEIFDLKLKGSLEAQGKSVTENTRKYNLNTYEYSIENQVHFPKFLLPKRFSYLNKIYNPQTSISINYNYQTRPDFTRTITNASFGYRWRGKQSNFHKHIFNLLEINSINVKNISTEFADYIKNLYIQNSYKNQLIEDANYTYIYNNQNLNQIFLNHIYFRASFETAGNLLNSMALLSNSQKVDGSYLFFDTRFAQYLKTDFDFRYYFTFSGFNNKLEKPNSLVFRTFAGVGMPYGNSKKDMPFVKKYYSGGANSLRAWQVRSLGPGSFRDSTVGFANQLGDIKLEGNIEYRFTLFWVVEGAVFLDVGNIWAMKENVKTDGTQFNFNKFYQDLAVGTGLGTRFDFTFFLLRFDFGLKLRDPQLSENKWIPSNRSFTNNDWTFNVGIGYPF